MKKRFNVILSFVRPAKVFADVGCDHGKIAVAVKKSGAAEKVIASDVSAPSLRKARELADLERIDGLITVLSDGFSDIRERVDEACIAGMGGEEIIKILSAAKELPDRLILQPMKNSEKLRRFLVGAGFPIEADKTIFDGDKFYDIIVADRRADITKYSDDDYFWGRDNGGDNEDFVRYLKGVIETYRVALPFASGDELRRKLARAEKKLRSL